MRPEVPVDALGRRLPLSSGAVRELSTVLDRYGHLLAGTEERTTEALDVMAKAATRTPRVADVTPLR